MDINFRFVLCVIVNSSSTVSATVAVDVAVISVVVDECFSLYDSHF